MKLHPRTLPAQRASNEIEGALWALADKHNLTYGEMMSALTRAMQSVVKYLIRSERHPDDPEKRGDEE